MNLDELKRILELVRDHELSEFEIEHDGLRLKIRKDAVTGVLTTQSGHGTAPFPPAAAPAVAVHEGTAPSPGAAAPAAPAPTGPQPDSEIELAVVKSPIVGTFYRSSEPNAPAFVEIGSTVKKGQVLCIIEAMKLMNEIDSEYDGEIANVYVENGQPVQYGERLFAIRTR
jgi:acetyl-CoA carboxylase biotin carboxyl carrier protein